MANIACPQRRVYQAAYICSTRDKSLAPPGKPGGGNLRAYAKNGISYYMKARLEDAWGTVLVMDLIDGVWT
jgi:hypothetical protein